LPPVLFDADAAEERSEDQEWSEDHVPPKT
jgi:hypothetical protein